MPVPDSNLIYAVPVQTYFVDKDTGAPLSAGVVTFYKDSDRTASGLKNVYQQSNNPPYTFTSLGSQVTLSGVGTFQDGSGNDINVYLYPYEGTPFDITRGVEELYYLTVYSADGVLQETRSAWPPNVQADFGSAAATNSLNQITNSQFVDVLFSTPTTFTVSGTDTSTEIAPGWFVLTSGSGTFTVSQIAVASGTSTNSTGAPYELTIASASLTSLQLYQRITGSPLLLAGGPVYGYAQIASSGGPQAVSLTYAPSTGTPVSLAGPTNTNGDNSFTTIDGAAIVVPTATGTAPTAYVDFLITLVPNITFKITSAQMLSVADVSARPGYFQESVPQQTNGLYYYDKPNLFYKPIPSYLTGWDFPLNPVQALGPTVAASAIGANKSKYVWDQTIIFQSVDSGVGVTRGSAGEIVLTAALTTQMALVQYLDATQARKLLNGRMSVNIAAKASVATNATISLWYTTDVSLPVITAGTNNSIVATLGTNGSVATQNGTWLEVPRSGLGDAMMTIGVNATTAFNDYNFSGWDLGGIAGTDTATYFAIVIGTASVTTPGTVSFYSVGLCAGDIATRPAPQTPDEVLRECQYYYQKSFLTGTIPATNTGVNTGESYFLSTIGTPNANYIPIRFAVPMRTTPTAPTLYNPAAANAQIRNISANADYSSTSVGNIGGNNTLTANGFVVTGTPGTASTGNLIGIHWTVSAQLGVI